MSGPADPLSLEGLCKATRASLGAFAVQLGTCGDGFAVMAIEIISESADRTVANQAIMALRALIDHVPDDHVVPLYSALSELEVDSICGDQCLVVARLLDQMIEHEATERKS
ncbi:hypothetical protein CL628_00255 [bacterium]|nr:hypothetical protein [bacterium]|tara:strand:- start:423 stop:758 length:336 start_codon:yes stop_codon:yes gene_type:complete